jgi:Rrf2 family iron-sulfur cluster assembly transcriptional regulator
MMSKTAVHATLALSVLAELQPGQYAGSASIAEQVGAPPNYLGKLLKQLGSLGLLESQKGFGGGFRLAKPAKKISLFDIAEPFDRVSRWDGCFLGRSECNADEPCPVHDRWSKIRERYLKFLRGTTVAGLARK